MKFFITRRNKASGTWRLAVGAMAIVITAVAPVSAQEKPGDSALTARYVFERLQSPALEILSHSSRLDMLDYWDADSVYQSKNAVNGRSWLTEVTPDQLSVNITPVSTLQIKMLPVKGGKVAMTVYTVGGDGQARDSKIDFYDPVTLRQLEGSRFFTEPDLKTFFNIPKGSSVTLSELREMIPFMTVEYTVVPGSDDISARLTSLEFIGVDEREKAKPLLRHELKAGWKGKYNFK